MTCEATVAIPFHNAEKHLAQAIDSVVEQTFGDWKLFLINDGSTDGSLNITLRYLHDPRVNLIQHPSNLNLSRSLNAALRFTDTRYFLHLDADDMLYPDALYTLYREMREQPDHVAVVSGNVNVFVENKKGKVVKEQIKQGRAFSEKYDFLKANSTLCPRFYRTEALRSVGGWPTDGPAEGEFCEDLNILFRLVEKYKFHWIDVPLLYIRKHADNKAQHPELLADSVKWAVRTALKRWGDYYDPVFTTNEEGWTLVEKIIPKRGS